MRCWLVLHTAQYCSSSDRLLIVIQRNGWLLRHKQTLMFLPVVFLCQYFVAGFFSQLRDSVIFPLFVWNSPTVGRRQLAWTNFGSRGATVIRSKEGGGAERIAHQGICQMKSGVVITYLNSLHHPPHAIKYRSILVLPARIDPTSRVVGYGINQMASQQRKRIPLNF